VAELLATTPAAGLGLPMTAGGATLEEWLPGPITALAPYAAGQPGLVRALAPLGLAWPAPGRMTQAGALRLAFAGRGVAFLIGAPPPDLAGLAAVTDQSDGWAGLRLAGPAAPAVLARLVALDLRPAACPPDMAVRALLNHMPLCLMRGDAGFDLLVFRSMARTAVHDLLTAMRQLAAREAPG
jgi:sarcosine oxidase subunit gamma